MGTTTRFHAIIAALAALGLALGMGSAVAGDHEDIYQNEVADSTDLTSDDLSDRQLEAFLNAAGQVQDIRASYAEMLREAGDADERAELRQGAADDMETAIQFAGIDIETYRGIGYLYRNDDEVRRRLDRMASGM
ncbi:DUF4168 domain-containing protein [Aquisalimonas sp. 2447]|uniref:DUF4168 domain-containing protein n=1 Tax=Aquisalimonas sp. 2447 TaxID=2740807 RepID=UPI0014326AC3|nr:DUF4168 domain-containing protein [Aquisalimonas sp. 2447]QIT53975.1 DUF4168 domain-containing protein [Aquisalimonas sp. 2447]